MESICLVPYTPDPDHPCLDRKLVDYRQHRPPRTSGSPYYVLGEPIGDLRDNMGCKNRDLAPAVRTRSALAAGVPVTLSREREAPSACCVFFLHGGGFIGGSTQVVENPCRYLAQVSGGLVVNIDYRLAPEAPFPDGLEDCLRAIREVIRDESIPFDRRRVYIAGDSAGANLALACIQKLGPAAFAGAMLYYPVVDLDPDGSLWQWDPDQYRGSQDPLVQHCAASLRDHEPLTRKLYLQDRTTPRDPLVSPLRLPDGAGMCPLLIQYAEYDYLRPQIEAFVRRMRQQGTAVEAVLYQGLNHAFLDLFGILDQSQASVDKMNGFIQQKEAAHVSR